MMETTAATEELLDVESIKALLDGFDPATLLPDLSGLFGSLETVCRWAVMIGPVILLVLGMVMDMAPIILISTPILLPIATSIGIDPIQFGIMMVLNCGIGLLTPPVGAVLFIGSAVGKTPMEKVVKATLPFYLCMIITLLLITFIPDISLLIPKLLGGYVPTGTGIFG